MTDRDPQAPPATEDPQPMPGPLADAMAAYDAATAAAPIDPRDFSAGDVVDALAGAAPGEYTPDGLRAMLLLEQAHEKYQGGRVTVLTALRTALGETIDTAAEAGEGPDDAVPAVAPATPADVGLGTYDAPPADRPWLGGRPAEAGEAVLVRVGAGLIGGVYVARDAEDELLHTVLVEGAERPVQNADLLPAG